MDPRVIDVVRSLDREKYPARDRVDTTYNDGRTSVHYGHHEAETINENGKAFNGRLWVLAVPILFAIGGLLAL